MHLHSLLNAVPTEPVNFESEYPFKKAQKYHMGLKMNGWHQIILCVMIWEGTGKALLQLIGECDIHVPEN